MYECVPSICLVFRGQNWVTDLLELKRHTVGSCRVHAGAKPVSSDPHLQLQPSCFWGLLASACQYCSYKQVPGTMPSFFIWVLGVKLSKVSVHGSHSTKGAISLSTSCLLRASDASLPVSSLPY